MPFTHHDIQCICRAKDIIDADLRYHHSIHALAEKAYIGQTKLKKGFHMLYGIALFSYLRQQRMMKAADLLADKNKTIKQVAKAVGFRYSTNFLNAFVKYYGVTPGNFRKGLPQ